MNPPQAWLMGSPLTHPKYCIPKPRTLTEQFTVFLRNSKTHLSSFADAWVKRRFPPLMLPTGH